MVLRISNCAIKPRIRHCHYTLPIPKVEGVLNCFRNFHKCYKLLQVIGSDNSAGKISVALREFSIHSR